MKKKIKTLIVLFSLILVSFASISQEKQSSRSPRWVSEKGYWVVESSLHQPLNHIIRFYDNDDALIYTETLSGVKLNMEKRRVKMKLKKALEATLLSWQQNRVAEKDKNYIAAILK